MTKYILSLDISMQNTGYSIFTNDAKPIEIGSISTNPKHTHGYRLHVIGKFFNALKKRYSFDKVIIEQGFSRFNKSTQVIYRVFGLINYLFYNVEQIYIPSTSVRKLIGGSGDIDKEEVLQIIAKKYSKIEFKNYDESDAFAVGLAYFYKTGVLKNAKKNTQKNNNEC